MKHISKAALQRSAIELKGDDDDPINVVTKALTDLQEAVGERLNKLEEKGDDPKPDETLQKLEKRLAEVEKKANRPGGDKSEDQDENAKIEKKAYGTYLRRGENAPAEELKALTVSDDTQGGYLAPAETSSEFIRDLVEFSPIRSIASVRNITGPSVKYPKRTSGTNAQWEGEGDPAQESTIALGQAEVTARELRTYVDISNQLLADSGGTAEAEVNMALAEDYGKAEGTAFVNGDGVLQPEGFMTNADVGFTVNGHATVLANDPLLTLMYAMPSAYRNKGTWVMNGTTLAAVRKLKDGNGNYLWQPAYQAGQPETLLGRPVVEAIDMPDIASGTFPIAFGNFETAYRIVDRLAMSILVNPYSLATTSVTRIHATRRVGGRVIQASAIRKLKMSV